MTPKKVAKKKAAAKSEASAKAEDRRTRTMRTREEKADIIGEYDLAPRGYKGEVLEKYGIPATYISIWRKQLGQPAKRPGRRPGGGPVPAPDFAAISEARDSSALLIELQQARETIQGLRNYLVKIVEWIDEAYPIS